jgi:hypothetical protein
MTSEIDICDWYTGPFDIPYPPGYEDTTGSLTGILAGYPDQPLPSMRVVAINADSGFWFWVGTLSGQDSYYIDGLLPGTYYVLAYPDDEWVGAHANPSDNSFDYVTIIGGQTTTGVDINVWLPPSAFPPDPTQ